MNQQEINSISILGCGWLGLPLATVLSKKGYSIKGSTTSENKMELLKSNGIDPFIVDLNKRDYEISNFLSSEVLIIAIPSKNVDGFKNLLLQIEKSNVKKVIFISSTSVYRNSNDIVTEESEIKKTPLSEIESLFKFNSHFKTTIVRFSGLIGYDRKPGNFFKNGKIIQNPEGFVNLIHRDDCLQIIKKIIELNIWDITLNASTDSHPSRKDFYTKEFIKEKRNSPVFNEQSLNEYKIVSNEKLKNLLSYRFNYSDLMGY